MRIAVFITEDWYAMSHRRSLLAAAVAAGHDVFLLTHVRNARADLEATGATVIGVNLDRSGRNLAVEARTLAQVVGILRRVSPDVLHNVALKPILYGTAAARIAGVPRIVNALAGMGSLFAQDPEARPTRGRLILRRTLAAALCAGNSRVVVQNPDDREVVKSLGVAASRVALIRGAGVDLARFAPVPEPPAPPVVVRYLGRLLWTKGLGDLHDAAVELADDDGIILEAYGRRDSHNPECVDNHILDKWAAEGALTIGDHAEDIGPVIAGAHIVVLPSYREGLPRVLLEAAASGRAIVATDVPGCREVVRHGRTGLMVPPRNPMALAAAIRSLAGDPEFRGALAAAARAHVSEELSDDVVNGQTLALYDLLSAPTANGEV